MSRMSLVENMALFSLKDDDRCIVAELIRFPVVLSNLGKDVVQYLLSTFMPFDGAHESLLAGVIFWLSNWVKRGLGRAGVRTLSKVSSLVLAAFAVMFVRRGLAGFLGGGGV